MLEWIFHGGRRQKMERLELQAAADNEVKNMQAKKAALDKVLEAILREHVAGRPQ